MKIREVLKLTKPYLPGGARSVAADRTQTMVAQVQAPNRIARRRERLPAQDSFAAADANGWHDWRRTGCSRPITNEPRAYFHAK